MTIYKKNFVKRVNGVMVEVELSLIVNNNADDNTNDNINDEYLIRHMIGNAPDSKYRFVFDENDLENAQDKWINIVKNEVLEYADSLFDLSISND